MPSLCREAGPGITRQDRFQTREDLKPGQKHAAPPLEVSSPVELLWQEAAADPDDPLACGGQDTHCCLWKTKQRHQSLVQLNWHQ